MHSEDSIGRDEARSVHLLTDREHVLEHGGVISSHLRLSYPFIMNSFSKRGAKSIDMKHAFDLSPLRTLRKEISWHKKSFKNVQKNKRDAGFQASALE